MPIEPILDSLKVPQPLKAQAWEDWNRASDENDFKQRFDKIDLPAEVKARLWEEKYGQKAASAPTPAEQIKVAPTARPVFPPNIPKPKLPQGDLQRKPEDDMLPHEKFASMANKAADVANTHAIEKAGGTTLTKIYEGAQAGVKKLTEKALGEKYSATRERIPALKAVEFAGDVAKVVPQTIDSMFTPLGAAAGVAGAAPKIAAVAKRVPWLASPEAQAATSAAFSTQQAQELPPAFREAATDLNPETAARAVTATAMTALPFLARGQKPKLSPAAERSLIDKYADIRRMEEAATNGEGLPVDKSPYVGARMHAGREGIVADKLQTYGDALPTRMEPGMGFSPYGANPNITPSQKLPDARKYGLLEHYEEQFKETPNYVTPEGFKNINEVRAARSAMEQSMGPDVTKEIRDRLEEVYRGKEDTMRELAASGVISNDHWANIQKGGRNSKHLPLRRVIHYLDMEDQGKVPVGSNVMSLASQDLIHNRSKEGSALAIRDPFESIIEDTVKATNLISRNKVARKLGALSSDPRFAGIVEPMKEGESLPPNRGFISVLVDGKKQQYSVPKEVANAMKHMREEDIDFVTKWASKSAGALRAGATTLYAPFIPSNAIRDYQTATIASKVGFNPLDWADGFAEAINKGDDYRKYLRSGGSFAGFFEGKRNLPKTLEKLTEDPISKSIKETLNPVELMRKVGEAIELAPRLGVSNRTMYGPIKASIGKGGIKIGRENRNAPLATPYEAGWNARNATVDFSKSGNFGRVANMWVPFLNARLQGNINFYGSIKERPQASAFRLAAIAGLPAVATHLYLHKYYPKIAKDLAEYETDSNFIIPYGEEKDEQGRYTQVIKIPKGEIQPMTQGIEAFLTYLNKEDPKAYDRLAVKMLSGASPVPFAKEGKFDPATAGSAVIPPVAKGLLENWANKNFYTGQDIIPRDIKTTGASPENQYSIENTPELYVRMAKQMANMGMGVSPMQIQNLIKAQFGGLGRMAAEPNKGGNAFSTRFGTARGGRQQQNDFKKLDEVSEVVGNEDMDIRHQAERLMQQLNAIKDPQKRKDAFVAAMPADETKAEALTKQMERMIEKKSRRGGEDVFEQVLQSKKVTIRARMALDKLKELPPEERKPLYERWTEKKIISPAVEAEMERLITQQ